MYLNTVQPVCKAWRRFWRESKRDPKLLQISFDFDEFLLCTFLETRSSWLSRDSGQFWNQKQLCEKSVELGGGEIYDFTHLNP